MSNTGKPFVQSLIASILDTGNKADHRKRPI